MSTEVTTLDRSPPSQPYVNGMKLGSSVDAITGEVLGLAIDPTTLKEESLVPSDGGEHFSVKTFTDARELADTLSIGASSAVSVPVDGITVGGTRSVDFSSSDTTNESSMYYSLTWSNVGPIRAVADGFTLSESALKLLSDPNTVAIFRESYGDYFVSQIGTGASFTAVWQITASDSATLQAFKTSMTADVEAEGAAKGSASLEMAINKSAKEHHVSINCQYDIVGLAPGVEFDTNSVNTTFLAFQKVVQLVPTTAYLKHYNTVDHRVPYTIPMDPTVYDDLTKFYGEARFVQFLAGVAPGSQTSREQRGEQVRNIFRTIISQRQKYTNNPVDMEEALRELKALHTKLENLLERQELLESVRTLTYYDIKKRFNVDNETEDGAWVFSQHGTTSYEFGRNAFDDAERKRYGVVVGIEVDNRKFGAKVAHSQASQLTYPGNWNPVALGYVVGVIVEDNWHDGEPFVPTNNPYQRPSSGTNGRWCVPRDNPLGTTGFKIPIHSRVSRGVNWTLRVSYIPYSEYSE